MSDDTNTPDPNAWRSGLPEELKTAPALKDIKDVATLAKAFVDTKALVGASLRPPGADATPEARREFIAKLQEKAPELVLIPDGDDETSKLARDAAWARLGRPKEAKDYAAPADAELPEEVLEALRKEALEEGLTKSQFAARAKRAAEAIVTSAHARKEATSALKRELGAAFDERTAAAAALASKLGFPAEIVSDLKAGTVAPNVFHAFDKVARGFGEERNVAGQGPGRAGKLTPSEAKAQRDEIMLRPEYFDPKPAQLGVHAALVAKVRELNELIDAGA